MLFAISAGGQEPRNGECSLEAQVPDGPLPVEGPVPVHLLLTYRGRGEVELWGPDPYWLDLQVVAPKTWRPRSRSRVRHVTGRFPIVTVSEASPLSLVVYLHDYFTEAGVGRASLSFRLRVWSKAGGAQTAIVLSKVLPIDIAPPNPEAFRERLRTITAQIQREGSSKKRRHLYGTIKNLSHADLIPTFLQALRDTGVSKFHRTARDRVVSLCEVYGGWDLVIEHLAGHGGRLDEDLFASLGSKGVKLTAEQRRSLTHSRSLWVRLYALKHCSDQFSNSQALVASLESHLTDLRAETLRLKKRNNGGP